MSVLVLGVVLGFFAFVLVLVAWEWVRVLVRALRWAEAALSTHGAPSPDSQPIAGPGSGGHPKGAQRPPTQEGVDDRGGVGYPARHYLSLGPVLLLGVVLHPDFESFFGGFATAVAAGGVVLFAVVVVMAVRRLTSF